jgi:hypothetical protein
MSNDSKLGLVVGMGLVIAVAVVFFRKEVLSPPSPAGATISAALTAPPRESAPPRLLPPERIAKTGADQKK